MKNLVLRILRLSFSLFEPPYTFAALLSGGCSKLMDALLWPSSFLAFRIRNLTSVVLGQPLLPRRFQHLRATISLRHFRRYVHVLLALCVSSSTSNLLQFMFEAF